MKPMLIFANETIVQGLIRSYPYPAGYYKVVNYASMPRESLQKLSRAQIFPNGDFQIIGKIININLILTHSYRHNNLIGNDNF